MWYTKKRREKFSLRFSALYCLEKPGIEVSKYFQEQQKKESYHAKAVYKNTRRK